MKKIMITALFLFFLGFVFAVYLFWGSAPRAESITWGVNFSQKHTESLGLDWKETYSALIDELGAKNLRVAFHWDSVEPEKDVFYFDNLDWQVEKAEESGAKIIPVIGMRTSRWPECHIPSWARGFTKEEQQEEVLEMVKAVASRYGESKAVLAWQVENEPFFPFGECPWADKGFLEKEIAAVRSADPLSPNRQVVIGDSGEGSFWIQAAKAGDVVGTTMYRKVWFDFSWMKIKFNFLPGFIKEAGFYLDYNYLFPSKFYWLKAEFIEKVFGKKVVVTEFQAEPWCANQLMYDCPLEEQKKTMNLEQFKKNVEFARKTGFDTFYFWGAEWWYWMKEKQNKPEIWNEVRELIKTSKSL